MKCLTPEISWHSREPIHALDFQPREQGYRLVSCGQEHELRLWKLNINFETSRRGIQVEFRSCLKRHQDPVNVARFSSCGKYIASGDVRQNVMIWHEVAKPAAPDIFGEDDDEVPNKENWAVLKILRGHCQEVWDLAWSPDSLRLVTVSRDPSVIVWDVEKGRSLEIVRVTGQVRRPQGVAYDPLHKYFAVIGLDRSFQVHRTDLPKFACIFNVSKADVPVPVEDADVSVIKSRLFLDENTSTFFRRLAFTPDGNFLIIPAGCVEYKAIRKNVTHIFRRDALNKPCLMLPLPETHSIVVRCNPVLYNLMDSDEPPALDLPYRMVFAVATLTEVLVYDTQHPRPLAYVTNIHYQWITDLAWSNDGRVLMVCSLDGYCTIIAFDEGELGTTYIGPAILLSETKAASPKTSIASVLDAVVAGTNRVDKEPVTPRSVVPPKPAAKKVLTLDKFIGSGKKKKKPDRVLNDVRCIVHKLVLEVTQGIENHHRPIAAVAAPTTAASSLNTAKRGNKTPKRAQLISLDAPSASNHRNAAQRDHLQIVGNLTDASALGGSNERVPLESSCLPSQVAGLEKEWLSPEGSAQKTPSAATPKTSLITPKTSQVPNGAPIASIFQKRAAGSPTSVAGKDRGSAPSTPCGLSNSANVNPEDSSASLPRSEKRKTPGIADYFRKMSSPQFQTKKRRLNDAGVGDAGNTEAINVSENSGSGDDCKIGLVVLNEDKGVPAKLEPSKHAKVDQASGSKGVAIKKPTAVKRKKGAIGTNVAPLTQECDSEKIADLVDSVIAQSLVGTAPTAPCAIGASTVNGRVVPATSASLQTIAGIVKPAAKLMDESNKNCSTLTLSSTAQLAIPVDDSSNDCLIISPNPDYSKDNQQIRVPSVEGGGTVLSKSGPKPRPLVCSNKIIVESPPLQPSAKSSPSVGRNTIADDDMVSLSKSGDRQFDGHGDVLNEESAVDNLYTKIASLPPVSAVEVGKSLLLNNSAGIKAGPDLPRSQLNGEKKKPKRAQLITLKDF